MSSPCEIRLSVPELIVEELTVVYAPSGEATNISPK